MIEAKITPAIRTAPQEKDWESRTLADLIRHIIAAHHEYLREELPALETLLMYSAENRSEPKAGSIAG